MENKQIIYIYAAWRRNREKLSEKVKDRGACVFKDVKQWGMDKCFYHWRAANLPLACKKGRERGTGGFSSELLFQIQQDSFNSNGKSNPFLCTLSPFSSTCLPMALFFWPTFLLNVASSRARGLQNVISISVTKLLNLVLHQLGFLLPMRNLRRRGSGLQLATTIHFNLLVLVFSMQKMWRLSQILCVFFLLKHIQQCKQEATV